MSRNITPRPVKAQGARDAHGRILERGSGSLYVHLHREAGLAHRHYVLKPWQVRFLAIFTSRPMLLLYLIGIASWGWLASQAARVPLLRGQVASLTADARRLDTLSAALTELQSRYDHVQRLLGTETTSQSVVSPPARPAPAPARRSVAAPARDDSLARTRARADSLRTKAIADSVARAKASADSIARTKASTDSLARARTQGDSTASRSSRGDTPAISPGAG